MKIRLAKKIMKELLLIFDVENRSLYWALRWLGYAEHDGKRDHRITKAISLTRKSRYGNS